MQEGHILELRRAFSVLFLGPFSNREEYNRRNILTIFSYILSILSPSICFLIEPSQRLSLTE